MKEFLKNAFNDMKESARAQHEVDKANFQAVKAESKANFQEAKAMGKISTHKEMINEKREQELAEAEERRKAAEKRIENLKSK
ncbi:MAG: hypothetical protein IJ025_02280 [Clostridia bacterium]|nr:hypothetical protein [Clostridia bacterium]